MFELLNILSIILCLRNNFLSSLSLRLVFNSLQNDLEQVLRQIGDKDQKIQNLEALLQKSKENISLLEKEREDLYAKIQAGEGETAVLNQLQEKNHTLQEQVSFFFFFLKFTVISLNLIKFFT